MVLDSAQLSIGRGIPPLLLLVMQASKSRQPENDLSATSISHGAASMLAKQFHHQPKSKSSSRAVPLSQLQSATWSQDDRLTMFLQAHIVYRSIVCRSSDRSRPIR